MAVEKKWSLIELNVLHDQVLQEISYHLEDMRPDYQEGFLDGMFSLYAAAVEDSWNDK